MKRNVRLFIHLKLILAIKKVIIKNIDSYVNDILAHVEQTSNKDLSYVKSNLKPLLIKQLRKRKRLKTNRFLHEL